VKPEFVVCDESVAALDVSIRAQVLNLFMDLKAALDLTYLFISHDLGVVEHISDRIVVMYLGRVVESGPTAEVYATPNHPYTRALLAKSASSSRGSGSSRPSRARFHRRSRRRRGCHFHPRCPHAMARCVATAPPLTKIAPGRLSACYLNDES
jgi:peptide/nickel transport system ATP-binding protein